MLIVRLPEKAIWYNYSTIQGQSYTLLIRNGASNRQGHIRQPTLYLSISSTVLSTTHSDVEHLTRSFLSDQIPRTASQGFANIRTTLVIYIYIYIYIHTHLYICIHICIQCILVTATLYAKYLPLCVLRPKVVFADEPEKRFL